MPDIMLGDFVRETANNPGTSATFNLIGPVTGARSFVAAFGSGAVVNYVMKDGTKWEVGEGYSTSGSPNTFTRDTVIANSDGTTSRINFTAAVEVYNTLPAYRVGWVMVQAPVAASAVASVDFPLPEIFTQFRLTLRNFKVSSAGQALLGRFSSDGGATFLSSGSYRYQGKLADASTVSAFGAGSQTEMQLSSARPANDARWFAEFRIEPGSGTNAAIALGRAMGITSAPTWVDGEWNGAWDGTAARMNALRLSVASGTLTFDATLEGMR